MGLKNLRNLNAALEAGQKITCPGMSPEWFCHYNDQGNLVNHLGVHAHHINFKDPHLWTIWEPPKTPRGNDRFYLYVDCDDEGAMDSIMEQGFSRLFSMEHRRAAYEHKITYEVIDGEAIAIALDEFLLSSEKINE